MKKIVLVLLAMVMLSGCMASFPAKYDPKFSMNPSLGKNKVLNATCKFESAFGKEVIDESIKLQIRIDKKIEEWGFTKDKSGTHLDITVKNVMGGGETVLTVLTSVVCGLTLYIIPSVAIDKYRMTVIINEEGKEPITREYNSSITTYQEIAFFIWGLIAFSPINAKWVAVDNMVDNLMNDLALTPEQLKERQKKEERELEIKGGGGEPTTRVEQKEGPAIAIDKRTKVYVSFHNFGSGILSAPAYRYFHKKDCRHALSVPTEEVTAGEAIARGKSMCPDCFR